MKSLYEIDKDYLALSESLIESGGEVTPELEQALAINKEELTVKGTNYGFVVKQLEGEADIIDAEIKRLQQLKKSRENAIDRLKSALSGAMKLHGIEEIKTPLLKINFRKSEAVEIDSMEQLPPIYKVHTESVAADKKAIKEAIKTGAEIPGARVVEHQNIQIK